MSDPRRRENGRRGIRKVAGVPNRTEGRYSEELEVARLDGLIVSYAYEPTALVLSAVNALPCSYTPDYGVTLPDGSVEYHEVKGKHMWEDSWIKFKWAVNAFPQHTFAMARQRRDGSFEVRRFRGEVAR
jgi:hypothetical protein